MSAPSLLTADDEAQVDALWNTPPRRRPRMPGLAPLPASAVTVTITCRVCGTRAPVEITAPAKLCRECVSDLAATTAHVQAQLRATELAIDAHEAAWPARLAALDDDLSERYSRVHADRARAEARLIRARQGKWSTATDGMTIAQATAQAQAELDTVLARIEKTRRNPDNPLAALLEAEYEHRMERARLGEALKRWTIAAQEVEAARDELPF